MKKFLFVIDVDPEIAEIIDVGIVEAATRKKAVMETFHQSGLSKGSIRFIHVYDLENIQPFWYVEEK